MVPQRRPRRQAQSSTPKTRGVGAWGGGVAVANRSKVSALTTRPRSAAIRRPASPPSARADQTGEALGKDGTGTSWFVTAEAAGLQIQPDGDALPGEIGGRSAVATVDALGQVTADRAGHGGPGRRQADADVVAVGGEAGEDQTAIGWEGGGDEHGGLLVRTRRRLEAPSYAHLGIIMSAGEPQSA